MRLRTLFIVTGVAVLLLSFGLLLSEASAGSGAEIDAAGLSSPPVQIDDSSCLFCHSDQDLSVQLESGETLDLTIDPDAFDISTHGSSGVTCVTCHSDIETFPHPERTARDIREFKLDYYTICRDCHVEQFDLTLDSVHQRELAAGNNDAAVCTDCHNPHTQQRLTNETSGELLDYARLHIPETCAQCHSVIYDTYRESVHGSALTQQGNLDVPTCIDCHGVHNIQSPGTATFRNSTPFLCAECHTNNALMHKYGLSTDVLNTYVSDFHGTTVVLFEKSFPDQPTNKPVCTDCHGVHDIARADDPNKGLQTRENLLARCQQCHPDATTNFPDSWMSHYIPSPEKYPIVYYVNLFYKFFIPAVLGPMIILVVMDFSRMMINRFKRPKSRTVEPLPEAKVEEGGGETPVIVTEPTVEAVLEEPTRPEETEQSAPDETEVVEKPEEVEQAEMLEEPQQVNGEPDAPQESEASDDEEEKSDDR